MVQRTYLFSVGKRKTAIARVRLYQNGSGTITINKKTLAEYFPIHVWQTIVMQPLVLTGYTRGDFSIKVAGGGVQSQAESSRHGIARVLLLADPDYRKVLKPAGLLTRDARVKERKKYGLKRARRAPQWQKR
ncbi:MAG: 30S ribosomal protein S9 [bacterium]